MTGADRRSSGPARDGPRRTPRHSEPKVGIWWGHAAAQVGSAILVLMPKTSKNKSKWRKTIIKHPFGNGSHHLFMMIWGMVYIIVLPLLNADFMKLRLQVSTPLFFFYNPHKFLRVRLLPPPCWGESAGGRGIGVADFRHQIVKRGRGPIDGFGFHKVAFLIQPRTAPVRCWIFWTAGTSPAQLRVSRSCSQIVASPGDQRVDRCHQSCKVQFAHLLWKYKVIPQRWRTKYDVWFLGILRYIIKYINIPNFPSHQGIYCYIILYILLYYMLYIIYYISSWNIKSFPISTGPSPTDRPDRPRR